MDELLKQKTAAIAALKTLDGKISVLLAHDEMADDQRKEHEVLKADRAKAKAKIGRLDEAIANAKEIAEAEAAIAVENANAARDDRRRKDAAALAGRITDHDKQEVGHTAIPAEPKRRDPKGGYSSPREFMMEVMEVSRGRVSMTNRLAERRPAQMTVGSDEARGNSDPAGGFLVPEAFSPDLLRINPETDPMAGLTRQVPMQFPTVKIPARTDKDHSTSVSGGLTVTRRPETVAGTAAQMTLERVVLEAHELFGLSYATEEILTDSPMSFVALLEAGFSDQFTYHLINERLNGTGVGEYLGIMNSGCLVTVNKESGQAATTITKENIDKMRSRCWRYGQAAWLANHDTLPQLKSLVQIVGVGGAPVPYLSVDPQGNATLDGRPCIFTEYAKTLGTAGDLVLGVWSEYLEGTYQPLMNAESIHVRFVNHERAFKFWMRNAGQPWWRTALTPKNSTNTLSPFVVLQTRS